MPENRDIDPRSILQSEARQLFTNDQVPIIGSLQESPEKDVHVVEPISTAFSHDELARKKLSRLSEDIWRDKLKNHTGTQAMQLRFVEIDEEYDAELENFLNPNNTITIDSQTIVPGSILREISYLFRLVDEREEILEAERERIRQEKIKRIQEAREFFIRGLVAGALDEHDNTKF